MGLFLVQGTTAGSDIIVAKMNNRLGWKTRQAILFIGFFVISFAGIIFHLKQLSNSTPA